MDEVRLFLLLLLYLLVFVAAWLILGLFLGLLFAAAGAQAVVIMLWVLLCISCAWFGTKVSLTFPLTLKTRAFAIGEGWRMTSGRFWTLFATYLLIFVILLIIGVATVAVTEPDYVSAIFRYGPGSVEAEQASLQQYQQLLSGTIDAKIIIGWVLTALQGTIGYALLGGATATAVQQLTADSEGLRETFS